MKRFTFFILALFVAVSVAAPAYAAYKDMWAYVYKWEYDGQQPDDMARITSGVTFKVLQAGSDTAETLYQYNDNAYTSLTNPVSTTNFASDSVCHDRVAFRVDPGETNDTSVDVIVVDTAGGYTAFIEDFNATKHRIVIDERPNVIHHGMIWVAYADFVETDTGIDFDYDTALLRFWVDVTTADSGETMSWGLLSTETLGDADGLGYSVSTASAGYVDFTGVNLGVLMVDLDGDEYVGGHGIEGSNAQSLTYLPSDGSDTMAGYLHYEFIRLR